MWEREGIEESRRRGKNHSTVHVFGNLKILLHSDRSLKPSHVTRKLLFTAPLLPQIWDHTLISYHIWRWLLTVAMWSNRGGTSEIV